MASTPASPSMSTFYQNPTSEFDCDTLESTLTLVDPPPPRTFVFNRNSVHNATLYSCVSPVYTIKSTGTLSCTDLIDLGEQKIVASIKRRQILPDVVVFPHRNSKPIRIDKWLKPRKAPFGQTPYANLKTLAGTFIWRLEGTGSHRFALYFDGQDDSPIAYSRSILDPPTIGLILMPGLDNVLVEIITSFLILENKFRMDQKTNGGVLHPALNGFYLTVGSLL
ncbi:hypothetical protein BYT27DRAFT_6434430 [Phlegmacium glaucopus]|nr:hypothetical protein BYT27DRAFT_6434430 [Phlegmacium glaucopus]